MDFYEKEVSNFGGIYGDAIIPTTVQQPLITTTGLDGKQTVRFQESMAVIAQTKTIVQVQPSTTVASGLLGGGIIEFRLEKGYVDVLDHSYIVLQITNSTGSSCTIQATQLLLDHIDYFSDNGNKLLFTIYSHEMWISNCYYSFPEWSVIAPFLGSNASYANNGYTIANNASVTSYIPLINFLGSLKINQGGLKGQLLIRCYFDSAALNVVTGSLPSVTNCYLELRGRMFPNKIKLERNKTYSNFDYRLPYLGIQRMNQQMTLAPSTQYSIVLSGIRGVAANIFFIVRALPFTAANQATYIQMSDMDVQDQNGQSILGFYRRLYSDMQLDYIESFNNLFINYVNVHMITFSNNMFSDFSKGTNYGSQCFTSFEKISFTTPSTLSSGSYQIDIWSNTHEFACITNGLLSTTRS